MNKLFEKNKSAVILSPEAGVKISEASVVSVVDKADKTSPRHALMRSLRGFRYAQPLKMTERGRSMIEMLGVLAIIGVLSVGGIAGYSKAMYRYKMNKTIDIFNRVLNEFVEFTSHRFDFIEIEMFSSTNYEELGMADYLESLREICTDREYRDIDGWEACQLPIGDIDAYVETHNTFYEGTVMGNFRGGFGVYFQGNDQIKACVDFLSYDWVHTVPQEFWYGGDGGMIEVLTGHNDFVLYSPSPYSSYVHDIKTSYTIADVVEACGHCTKDERCLINITFYGQP